MALTDMGNIVVKRKSVETVEYEGKKYTCDGRRTWLDGKLLWMYTDSTGLPYDILVCEDRYSEQPKFSHVTTLPGSTPIYESDSDPSENDQDPETKPSDGKTKA